MKKEMRKALLKVYENLDAAGRRQYERGVHDQGERSKVTGGHHMDPVAETIRNDLIACGYSENDVLCTGRNLKLPGYFRPSKNWDILAFDGEDLLAAIELKSINSSFSNNSNNRTEESLGSAVDAASAIKNDLIPFKTTPPVLGYVLLIRMCETSTVPSGNQRGSVYPIDTVFRNTSYFERLTIFCKRLLSERLYQAVWIVGVDTETEEIIEPSAEMSYEKFIAALKAQLQIHRA